jgi:5-methylcytosine-specific restriction endonuclease McrA
MEGRRALRSTAKVCECGRSLNSNSRKGMCSPCYRRALYWARIKKDPSYRSERNKKLRKRRAEGKDKISEATHAKRLERQRNSRRANPDKTRAEKYARRSTLGEVDKDYIKILLNDPCSYCNGPAGEVDHIDALTAGGTNDWDNMTAACKSCNSGKFNLPLLQYMLRRVS